MRLRTLRTASAVALLATMMLGGAFHLWHHVVDPDCTAEGRHGNLPCAICSALHHPVAPSDATPSIQPTPVLVASLTPLETERPAFATVLVVSTRAPPRDA